MALVEPERARRSDVAVALDLQEPAPSWRPNSPPVGHRVSHTVVGELLRQQKFSLQANRKTREGDSHPDRDAQFAYINTERDAARWPKANQ